MEINLRRLQEDLFMEWGKLEGQVTKLDLWMAENGYVVTEAASLKSVQLLQEKRNEQGHLSKIFEVVDELQLHKERILVQIGKFSGTGIKFNEYRIEAGHKQGDDTGPEMKIDLVPENDQDISDSLQDSTCNELPALSDEGPNDESILLDNYNATDNSNSTQGHVTCPAEQSATISKDNTDSWREFLCRKNCGKEFDTKESLKNHENDCRRNPPVQCSICSKTVKRKSLSNHMRLVHNSVQKPKPTPTKAKSTNSVPISTTSWNAPVESPICWKIIKQFCNLDYLMRTTHHPDRQPLPTKTKRPSKSVSTGESKPFPCSHCSKTFWSRSSLSYHMRSVRGERPYVCRTNCSASFPCPRNRNQHEEVCKGRGTLRGRKPVYV